ncbi:MAG: hypothetical protein ACRDSZ_19705 [Pseudonocardiaceae bacterium]
MRAIESATADPQRLLLDRIKEVCESRHERVKIRHVETEPPHLLITRQEEDFNPQWRVGAHAGVRETGGAAPRIAAQLVTDAHSQQRGRPLRAERRHIDHDRLLGVIEFVGNGPPQQLSANQLGQPAGHVVARGGSNRLGQPRAQW